MFLGRVKTCGHRNDCHVVGSKFLCPMVRQAKIPSIRFGSKERLSDWVGANWEDGRTSPWNPLKNVQSSGFFYVKRRRNGRSKRWLMITDIWAPARVWGSLCLVCWPSLMWVWSQGSCKSLINNIYFLYLLGRGTFFWEGSVFAKFKHYVEFFSLLVYLYARLSRSY